jgi:SAM-dependent methyltransferase
MEIALPPALLRYRVSESLSTNDFLQVGKACAQYIDEGVRGMSASLADMKHVLDFGCGCGRTLRWLIERYPGTQFYGADVDLQAIEWCARNLGKGIYVNGQPEPPLPFTSRQFDMVYCVSVFTHLDEQMQDRWLVEIQRILKPGGILILTVHGDRTAAGLDDEEAVQIFRDSGFTHKRSRKLSGILPDWYNTSWHSRSYILGRVGALFGDVRYILIPDGAQDLVVGRGTLPE